jgi:cytochrome c biogenesis protein CcmG/thiol:disulfide interchange protein DsbE
MNWRRSVVGLAAGLPVLGLLAWGLTRDATLVPSPLPGRPAPEFALTTLDGRDTVRLADLRGEVVVVNFWASWCLACRIEHRDLSRAAELYAGRNVRFFGLLFRDTPENGARWIEEMGGQSYPSLVDRNSRTGVGYGITAVPETFIIDQEGFVAHKYIGPVRVEDLAAVIEPLLGGEVAPR